MNQPRYTRTEGITYEVECSELRRPFSTYDRADQFLDEHEKSCPHAHRINRVTTSPVDSVNLLALDPRP